MQKRLHEKIVRVVYYREVVRGLLAAINATGYKEPPSNLAPTQFEIWLHGEKVSSSLNLVNLLFNNFCRLG